MFGNTQVVAHMTLEQYEVLWVYITYNGKTLHVCIYLLIPARVCVHVVSVSVSSFSYKISKCTNKEKNWNLLMQLRQLLYSKRRWSPSLPV